MISARTLMIFLAAFAASVAMSMKPAFADVVDKPVATEDRPDVYLAVPQADIDFSQYPDPTHEVRQNHLEMGASTWSPAGFSTESALDGTDEFHTDGVPKLSINTWSDKWTFNSMALAPKYGLSYDQLLRTGTLEVSGTQQRISQTVNLLSLRAGLELTPEHDLWGHLQPFVNASLLPTWAQSSESQFNDGQSHLYLSIEEMAGLDWRMPKFANWLGAKNLGIEVGLDATEGIGASPLTGVGIMAGTRIDL